MAHARRALTKDENSPGVVVKVTVTKLVSFRVERLRNLLNPKNVAE
jgi:hypothetical protein